MEKEQKTQNCIICMNPLTLFGVGSCNHKEKCAICHYKQRVMIEKIDCSICRSLNTKIMIHSDPDVTFEDFDETSAIPFGKGEIYFPNMDIQREFQSSIGLKCPIEGCDTATRTFTSEIQLSNHLKTKHRRYFW